MEPEPGGLEILSALMPVTRLAPTCYYPLGLAQTRVVEGKAKDPDSPSTGPSLQPYTLFFGYEVSLGICCVGHLTDFEGFNQDRKQ